MPYALFELCAILFHTFVLCMFRLNSMCCIYENYLFMFRKYIKLFHMLCLHLSIKIIGTKCRCSIFKYSLSKFSLDFYLPLLKAVISQFVHTLLEMADTEKYCIYGNACVKRPCMLESLLTTMSCKSVFLGH